MPDHLSANIFCECDDSSRIIVETDLAVWWHGLDAVIHLAAEGADELEENRVEKKRRKNGPPSVRYSIDFIISDLQTTTKS